MRLYLAQCLAEDIAMFTVRSPEEIESCFDVLAGRAERTMSFYVSEILLNHPR